MLKLVEEKGREKRSNLKILNFMKKGFTLIELLVVIAIIVILASIVLVGIQNATKKARDARIIASVSQLRMQEEMAFSDDNEYFACTASVSGGLLDTCADQPNAETLIKDINTSQKRTANTDGVRMHAAGDEYCIYVELNEESSETLDYKIYCIDSTGVAVALEEEAASVTCDSTLGTPSYVCPDDTL